MFGLTIGLSGVCKVYYSFDNSNWTVMYDSGSEPVEHGTKFLDESLSVWSDDISSLKAELSKEQNRFIYLKAIDAAGNEGDVTAYAIQLDKTAPTAGTISTNIQNTNGNTQYTNQPTFTVYVTNPSDSLSGIKNVDINAWYGESWVAKHKTHTGTLDSANNRYYATCTFANLPNTSTGATGNGEGTYRVNAQVFDNATNRAQTSTLTIIYDTTAPTAGTLTMKLGSSSGSDYSNGSWTNQNVYIAKVDGSDALSGHKSTTYSVTKGGIAYLSDQKDAKTLTEEGEYVITVTTTDNAGNTATNSYAINIDKTAPTAGTLTRKLGSSSGSDYENGSWTNQSVYIAKVNGSDALSGHDSTTYTVNGGSVQKNAQTLTETGTYNIVVTTKDKAGNTATRSYTIYIDKTAPTYTSAVIKYVDRNGYYVYLYGASDAHSGLNYVTFPTWTPPNQDDIEWPINDGTTTGSIEKDVDGTYYYWVDVANHNYEEGVYYTHIYLYDNVGNYTALALETYVDRTPPTVSLRENSNTTWSKTGNVIVNLDDDHSGIASGAVIKYGWSTSRETEPTSYTTASLSYTEGTLHTEFSATANGLTGKYYLWVVAETYFDVHKNSGAQTVISTGQFYLDNSPPVISPDVVQENLIRNYDADNNTGSGNSTSATTWKDLSGHNDGTVTGASFVTTSAPIEEYLALDGLDDWVNMGEITVTDNVTLEATIKINEIQSGEIVIMSNYQSGGTGLNLRDGIPEFQINVDGTWYRASSGTVLNVGQKYHILGTYDGANMKLYIDGVLKTTLAQTGDIKSPKKSTVMAIGTNPEGSTAVDGFANIKVYSARIYNRALTDSEVAQNKKGSIENKTWAKSHNTTGMISDAESGLATGAGLQYAWSTSNTTEPSFSTSATITSYTSGAANTTFAENGSGYTGKYYLWVKPTTLKDVLGNSQTATVASSTRVYFDNTAPTVGTMTMKLGSSSGSNYSGPWTNQNVYIAIDSQGSDAHSGLKETTYSVTKGGSAYLSNQKGAKTLTEEGEYVITVTTTDNAGNTATKTYNVNIDKTAPVWSTQNFSVDTTNKKVTVDIVGTDALSGYASNSLTTSKITVYVDGEVASSITKTLSSATTVTGGIKYTLTLSNFEQSSLQSGKDFKEWSGTVKIVISSGTLVDNAGNTSAERTLTLGHADFIKPNVKYNYSSSDIDYDGKSFTMVFDIIDKYYSASTLQLSDLQILIDGENVSSNTEITKSFSSTNITSTFNKTVSGTTANGTYVIGKRYTLTLSNLAQLQIKEGDKYLDYSGIITVSIPAGKVTDTSSNSNSATTITSGINLPGGTGTGVTVDVVKPLVKRISLDTNAIEQKAVLKIRATDKYLSDSTLSTSDIQVLVNGTVVTSGINVSLSSATELTETRVVSGTSSTVKYGVEYTITVTGFAQDANQVKVRILANAFSDSSGNGNAQTDFYVYNCLELTSSENLATSGFLGETSIQRQNIEKVVFVDNINGSTASGVQKVWDVSAQGDNTILAWYSETSAPYTVYIGSKYLMFANKNSTCLFSYLGYASSCTSTEVISNIDLLNFNSVTSMYATFHYCGYRSMTTLDLGTKFNTSNVTNMSYMFYYCGYSAMTGINFGDKFNTSNVTNMSYMFFWCGYTKMTTLDLGDKFDTGNVTDMTQMFLKCGYTKMTTLDLGDNFDTSSVFDMSYMFSNCGYMAMTTLDLGDKFDTSSVYDMSYMFDTCGYMALTSLDLGDKFSTVGLADADGMFSYCGFTSMTVLDLGPAFEWSVSGMNLFENCGKNGAIMIYVSETIYGSKNSFKFETYTRGTLNPIYRPQWELQSSTVDTTNKAVKITVKGSAYKSETINSNVKINYASNVTSALTAGNIKVFIKDTDITSYITPTVSAGTTSTNATSGKTEITHTITISDLDDAVAVTGIPYSEWSGYLSIKIGGRGESTSTYSANVLKDQYRNQSMSEIDTSGTWVNVKFANQYVDFVKPQFRYEYANTVIGSGTSGDKKVRVVFDVLDKYYNSSTIIANKDSIVITVLDESKQIDNSLISTEIALKTISTETTATSGLIYKTNGDIYYDVDGDGTAEKVGQRYELVISNLDQGLGFDYSGPMSIALPAGVISDKGPTGNGTNPNTNNATTITIGVDETDGNSATSEGGSQQIVDVVKPIWELNSVTLGSEGVVKIIAKDKYYSTSTLTADKITVYVNGVVSTVVTKTVTGPVEKVAGQEYEYTLKLSNITDSSDNYTSFTPTNQSELVTGADGFKYHVENGGDIEVEIASGTITDTSGNKNNSARFDIGSIDVTKPEMYQVQKTQNKSANTETFIFNITDRNYDPTDLVTLDEISLWVDNEQVDSLIENATLTYKEIKASVDGTTKVLGHQYTLVINNIAETVIRSGKSYLEWSGTLKITVDSDAAKDLSGNTLKSSTTTITDFVDYVSPIVKYNYSTSDIDYDGKSFTMVFDIVDKYYSASTLQLSDLQILIDGENVSSNTEITKSFSSVNITSTFNKTVSGSVTNGTYVIGKRYTLTLSNLEQLQIKSGDKYLDYSGIITVSIPAGKVTDTSNNSNNATTITSGINLPGGTGTGTTVDVVDPLVEKISSSAYAFNPTNKSQSIATLKIRATDKYLSDSTLATSDIQVLVNGSVVTSGINVSLTSATELTETRVVNGTSSTVKYGVEYTITVTGFAQNANQVKIRIADSAFKDSSGNGNKVTDLIVYNCLELTSSESSETSGFLGETSIQRQNIEKVVFVNSTSASTASGVKKVWDVSAQGDNSILAWYSQTSAPYTVYIGSNWEIFGNQNSTNLFRHIGYASTCTATQTIQGINLLNVKSITNMSLMFAQCGYTAMTSLDLGSNFDTSNVTNMYCMFWNCGYTAMTSLNLGSDFDTSNVTNMRSMFFNCGYTAMTSLNLGSKFDTSNVTTMYSMFNSCGYTSMVSLDLGDKFDTQNVTDMYLMFYSCGYTAMTSLDLGSKFDTSNVTNMRAMFAQCGYTAMTSLDLGDKFDTSSVTNMYSMFYRCGHMAMTSLDLGDKFDTKNVTNMRSMFNRCGYTAMTSLDLGDKFDTSNVTDMYYMFFRCGYTAMTILDLGPAFTKIPSGTLIDDEDGDEYDANKDMFTYCGKSGNCTIYAPESIYKNKNAFKLNSTDTSTTISYTRGTINPIYRPQWEKVSSAIDTTNQKLTVTVKGSAYYTQTIDSNVTINYASNVTSTLEAGDITVFVNGVEVTSTTNPTVAVATGTTSTNATSGKTDITHVITLSNLEEASRRANIPYKELSGNIKIKIGGRGESTSTYTANVLKDQYGNQNMMATDTTGTWVNVTYEDSSVTQNTNGKMFTDFIKPEYTYKWDNTEIGSGTTGDKKVRVVFDITDKYFNSSTITQATVVNNIAISLIDTTPATVIDATKITKTLTKKTISADSTDSTTGITYKANGDIYYDINGDGTKEKIGERYELVISNLDQGSGYDYSGPMSIALPAGVITDKSGNTNNAKTITIGVNETDGNMNTNESGSQQIVDVVNPVWEVGTTTITTNASGITTANIKIIATDKYFDKLTKTTAELKNLIQILVDGEDKTSQLDVTLTGPESDGITYTYTITGFEESDEEFFAQREAYAVDPTTGRLYREFSGPVKIVIPAGTIIDTSGNTNKEKIIDLGTIDTLKPEVIKVSAEVNHDDKTETIVFDIVDKYLSTSAITTTDTSKIHTLVDGVEVTNITKQITNIQTLTATVGSDTNHLVGYRYTLKLSNFGENSGEISIKINGSTATDSSGSANAETTLSSDFVDFIKPVIEKVTVSSPINATNKTYTMSFKATDKYFDTSYGIDISKITVKVDGETAESIAKPATVTESNKNKIFKEITSTAITGGYQYTLVLSNFEQYEKQTGKDFMEWSGTISIEIAENAVKDEIPDTANSKTKYIKDGATLYITEPNGTNENKLENYNIATTINGEFVDFVKPVIEKVSSTKGTDTETIVFKVIDKYIDTSDAITNSEINVYVDGENASGLIQSITSTPITNTFNKTQANGTIANGSYVVGYTYTVVLGGFEQSTRNSKNYKDWSGTVSIEIAQTAVYDKNPVTGAVGNSLDSNVAGRTIVADFVDFIKPDLKYVHDASDIDKSSTGKSYTMTFDITDKYYTSGQLTLNDVIIKMQNGQLDSDGNLITYNLKDEEGITITWGTPEEIRVSSMNMTKTDGTVATVSNQLIGYRYTITVTNLEKLEIAEGRNTADYSGVVTVAVASNKMADRTGNQNNAQTITSGVSIPGGRVPDNIEVVDVVDPLITMTDSSANAIDSTATVEFKVTDTYFNTGSWINADGSINTTAVNAFINSMQVLVNGTVTTSGITVSLDETTALTETRYTNNGISSTTQETVAYGLRFKVTITGFANNVNQVKLRIPASKFADKSGNVNKQTDIIAYNVLKNASSESSANSAFLGGSIQRQNIEKIIFLSSTATAPATGCWDVSAQGDNSIIAWTAQTSAPYTVYVASDWEMFANQNSIYLFRYIGYADTCTATQAIVNINLLNTNSVTNMTFMFAFTGYTAMETLDLGDNFDTSNVIYMTNMFNNCGNKSMTTLNLGANFDTSSVINMAGMFNCCGLTKLTSLNLGEKFNTGNVTNMTSMFQYGVRLTTINLGDKFDTSKVTNMSNMFGSCTNLTALNLGDKFNTGSVTNMSGMFSSCKNLTVLDLGNKFDTSKVTDMSNMFNACGEQQMTRLNLGDKFDTSSVTNMSNMFNGCGANKLTSLDLGEKFDTSNVTNMDKMFYNCGKTLMTVLDLGPAFTHLATDRSEMFKNCGNSSIVIYAPEAIYGNKTSFK